MTKQPGDTKRVYVTKGSFDGGANFREIAKVLTKSGKTINHATARNLVVSGIRKILQGVSRDVQGVELESEQVSALLKDKDTFQMVSDMLHKIYGEASQ